MKQFARSVPTILFVSAASLSLIALAGCRSLGNGNKGPKAAKNIYAIEHSYNSTTEIEQDSVLVFSASATGSATPSSTLMLPSNFLGLGLAVGPTGTIYVGGGNGDDPDFGQILEYPAGSTGSVTPTVTLNGASTGTFIIPVNLAVNSAGTLFVSSIDGSLEAFASGFTASSAPTQYLSWGITNFGDPAGTIGVDTAGDIFYLDEGNGTIDVFATGGTGTTAPVRTITGTDTYPFDELEYIAVDGAGDVYVANYNRSDDPNNSAATNPGTYAANKRLQAIWPGSASRLMARPHIPKVTYEPTEIVEFAAGASGNATPTKRISGSSTNIAEPAGLAVDAVGNLYYADDNGALGSNAADAPLLLEVFSSSANGNVAPAASVTSTNYTYWTDAPPFPVSGVAVY
jgi:hypothetical protein